MIIIFIKPNMMISVDNKIMFYPPVEKTDVITSYTIK